MTIRSKSAVYFALVLLLAGSMSTQSVSAAGSGGGGGLSAPASVSGRGLTPEQRSAKAFRAGIKHRDKALKNLGKADKASTDKKRENYLKKARKEFDKAIAKQTDALQQSPENYKAANELGFALRQNGEYRKAIGAYNYALQINPNFHEATEYRAEAFLKLGFLDETKQSYMVLFRNKRELADELMSKFDVWIEQKNGSLSESEEAFVAWVNERKQLASISQGLSSNNKRAW